MQPSQRFISRQMVPAKIGVLSALALLTACTVGPDFARPSAGQSAHYDQQAEQQDPAAQRFNIGKKSMVLGGRPFARQSSTK